MTAFARALIEEILVEGPMPVDRFMARVLAHYYATRDPFGAAGDFVTAPEISQMFGELLGLWSAHAWQMQGAPPAFALVELGPGRGTLMADALRALTKAAPACRAALSVHLVETSPVLRERQGVLLADAAPVWHDGIDTLPDGPMIVIANEFFDALPVRQFVRDGGRWRERLVGVVDGRLSFGLSAAAPEDGPRESAPEGTIIERGEAAVALAARLGARIARFGGALLAIDYGALRGGTGDTLQALRAHTSLSPLEAVGDADLTVHVDFAALTRAVQGAGLGVDFLGEQADFLDSLGLSVRAASLRRTATPDQGAAIDAAVARLTDRGRTGMGALFKVLAASKRPV